MMLLINSFWKSQSVNFPTEAKRHFFGDIWEIKAKMLLKKYLQIQQESKHTLTLLHSHKHLL